MVVMPAVALVLRRVGRDKHHRCEMRPGRSAADRDARRVDALFVAPAADPAHGTVGIVQCRGEGRLAAEPVVHAHGEHVVVRGEMRGMKVKLAWAARLPRPAVQEDDRRPGPIGHAPWREQVEHQRSAADPAVRHAQLHVDVIAECCGITVGVLLCAVRLARGRVAIVRRHGGHRSASSLSSDAYLSIKYRGNTRRRKRHVPALLACRGGAVAYDVRVAPGGTRRGPDGG